MKSKLFLSLSLLTAVFSMSANTNLSPYFKVTQTIDGKTFSGMFKNPDMVSVPALATPAALAKAAVVTVLPSAAIIGGGLLAVSYMQQPEVKAATRFERVKSALNNGYTSVKANAVKGYNLALENKGKTAGAVAAVAGLGLVAYKYSGSIFGKSKAVKAPVAPVAPQAPVRVAVAKRNLTR